MIFLVLGLGVGFAMLAFFRVTTVFGTSCYHLGTLDLNTFCFNPTVYFSGYGVAAILVILGFAQLLKQGNTSRTLTYQQVPDTTLRGFESEATSVRPMPAQFRYDRDRWLTLVEVDPEIAVAAERVREFGTPYEDELAEKYLTLLDKAYLPALADKIAARAEIETREQREKLAAATANSTAEQIKQFEAYMMSVAENDGNDPDYHRKVKNVTMYTGNAVAFKGGLKIELEDGRIILRFGFLKRMFQSEAAAEAWAS